MLENSHVICQSDYRKAHFESHDQSNGPLFRRTSQPCLTNEPVTKSVPGTEVPEQWSEVSRTADLGGDGTSPTLRTGYGVRSLLIRAEVTWKRRRVLAYVSHHGHLL